MRFTKWLLLTLAFLVVTTAAEELEELKEAGRSSSSKLPFSIPDAQIKPLRHLIDRIFQQDLARRLAQNRAWQRLIVRKKMAVGLVDLRNPYNVRFAAINGDVMMYAASLPKLAVLLAACQSFEDRTLPETPAILNDMRIMISRSDNAASTRMIDRIGMTRIGEILQDPRYEFYDPEHGGGLWIGKRYAKRGRRYPDPLMGLSHGATVTQVCRFYYLLSMGKLVSRERSKQMLGMLSGPELHHKFVNTLDHIVPAATLYRKSGSWRYWHSDSCLVWGPVWRRYIVVALVEDQNGEQILRKLIPVVEDVLRSHKGKAQVVGTQ